MKEVVDKLVDSLLTLLQMWVQSLDFGASLEREAPLKGLLEDFVWLLRVSAPLALPGVYGVSS